MSPVHRIAIVTAIATLLSGGCCLTRPYGGAGPSCGLAGYGGSPGCGAADCTSAGCDSCGGGPTIPCRDGACPVGSCLGLGCIGKLFNIASYGCTSCASGGGCGEVYYHDWISDPPCADPCDGAGNWTGVAAGDSCGGCSDIGCDGHVVVEPGCGIADRGNVDYGGNSAGFKRSGFQMTGRTLYRTWMGVGGVFRGVRRGFAPTCGSCNAFSFSESCASCAMAGPSCGGRRPGIAVYADNSFSDGHVIASGGRIPHEVVTNEMRTAHSRPPHKVLTNRIR